MSKNKDGRWVQTLDGYEIYLSEKEAKKYEKKIKKLKTKNIGRMTTILPD